MREIPTEKIFVYASAIIVTAVLTPFMSRFKRMRGKSIVAHVVFLVATGLMLAFIPEWVQDDLFSPGGVLLIGSIVPIYESIIAVCTVDETDDLAWLQFWLCSGIFSFATEFMDDITAHLPQAGEHWYEFEFFLTAWFMLPFTDGVAVQVRQCKCGSMARSHQQYLLISVDLLTKRYHKHTSTPTTLFFYFPL